MESGGDLSDLRSIKDHLSNILLHLQIKSLIDKISIVTESAPSKSKPAEGVNQADALDELETIATTKKDKDGKRTFLLHRLTADFEYQKAIRESREYETSEPTTWLAQFNSADQAQDISAPGGGANPVVSCWVPEADVLRIPNGLPNTGTWGELGKNPHSHEYKVIVKPGKYELYQELKE